MILTRFDRMQSQCASIPFPHRTKEKLISNQVVLSLLINQNIRYALMNSDRVYVVENGAIIMEGSREELRSNKSVKSAYLGL
jgi:ABC-type branched-subunit amino acid transport system ATPase component